MFDLKVPDFSSNNRKCGVCCLHALQLSKPVCFSEEADDDDDPEYNFLDDLDEPDLEDYRTDRAVQITSTCCGLGTVQGLEFFQVLFLVLTSVLMCLFFFF